MKNNSCRLVTAMCMFALSCAHIDAKAAASAVQSARSLAIPQLVQSDGRYALMVDGQPFTMLGVQAHNSSNYPGALDRVWSAVRDAHANTLEIPVAWEQVEAVEGKFDFSYVDTLVAQARQNKVRLVLLWFGTWKNTRPQYAPEWVKTDQQRFPRMLDKNGKVTYCLSPYGEETLKADTKAFVAFMSHLKKIDEARRTVIMVQVQNEVGTFNSARDYSPKAEAAFRQPVPQAVLAKKKAPQSVENGAASGTWSEVYGQYADEYFLAYSMASYIGKMAKAGRAVYNLPMYVNAAVRDSVAPATPWKDNFNAGGPTYDVIDIYQAAAPDIDISAADLYGRESEQVTGNLSKYQRRDNALFVPEMANAPYFARYIYEILGRGAIGIAPFGVDYADYTNYPLGAKTSDKTMAEPFGKIYAAFRPMERMWAKWSLEGRTHGMAESDERTPQTITMGNWKVGVTFREWFMGHVAHSANKQDFPPGTEFPTGGVAFAQIGENEFIVIGQQVRLHFGGAGSNDSKPVQYLRVEEGRFDASGKWIMERNWNGDQVDSGLNLPARPTVLRVRMGTY